MKTLYKILVFGMLSQSCQVYYRTSITIDKATNTTVKQMKKVTTKEGNIYKLRGIYLEGSKLYGLKTKKGEYTRLSFNIDEVEKIQLQNKGLSMVGNVLISSGVILLGIGILYLHEMSGFDCCDPFQSII